MKHALDEAFADVRTSRDRFCLLAGIGALQNMMEHDTRSAWGGERYARSSNRRTYRYVTTTSVLG